MFSVLKDSNGKVDKIQLFKTHEVYMKKGSTLKDKDFIIFKVLMLSKCTNPAFTALFYDSATNEVHFFASKLHPNPNPNSNPNPNRNPNPNPNPNPYPKP